jgi:hypothetical protein
MAYGPGEKILDAHGDVVEVGLRADIAAQIVTAVNSVGPLREALREIQHNAQIMNQAEPHQVFFSAIADLASAALALAQTEEKK